VTLDEVVTATLDNGVLVTLEDNDVLVLMEELVFVDI